MIKKIIKRIFLFSIICTLLVAAALCAFRFYLSTGQGQNWVKTKINTAIPGSVSWDNLDFSLTAGKVQIDGFLLAGPLDEKGVRETYAQTDKIYLDIGLKKLAQKEVCIDEFMIDTPKTSLVIDEQGRLNLLNAFPEPKEKKEEKKKTATKLPVNIVIKKFVIKNGDIALDMKAKKLKTHLEDILVRAGFNLSDQSGNLNLLIGKGNIESPVIKSDLEKPIEILASLVNGTISDLSINFDAPFLDLALKGSINEIGKNPVVDLKLDLGLILSKLKDTFGIKQDISGNCKAQIVAKGSLNDPDIDFHIDLGAGSLVNNPIQGIQVEGRLTDRLITLKSLMVAADAAKLNLNGKINLQNAFTNGFLNKDKDIDAIAYELNLNKSSSITLEKLPKLKAKIAGTLKPRFSVSGRGISPEIADITFDLGVAGKKIKAPGLADSVNPDIRAKGKLSRGNLFFETFNAKAGAIKIFAKGGFDLGSKIMDAALTIDAPNLDKTLKCMGIKDVKGSFALDTKIAGHLDKPACDLSLSGRKLAFKNLMIGNLDIKADLDKSGTLKVSKLFLKNQDSSIKGSGNVRVFAGGMTPDQQLPLKFSLKFAQIKAKNFMASSPAAGTISGNLDLKGDIGHLKAGLSLTGKDLGFKDIRIGDADLAIGLSKGKIAVERVELENKNSKIRLTGNAKIFEKEGFKLIKNPEFDLLLSSDGVYPKDFIDKLTGKFTIDVKAKGSVKSPLINLSLKGEKLELEPDVNIGDLALNLGIDKSGVLKIDRLVLENNGSMFDGSGYVNLLDKNNGYRVDTDPALKLTASLKNVEAKNFIRQKLYTGKIDGHIWVEGSLSNPVATLALDGKDLATDSGRLGNITINIGFSGGNLHINALEIQNRRSNLNISGSAAICEKKGLKVLKDPGFDFKISSASLFPQDFIDIMTGKLIIDASARGSLAAPLANLSLEGKGLEVKPDIRIGDIAIDAGIDNTGVLTIDRLGLANRGSMLDGRGSIHLLDKKNGYKFDPSLPLKFDLALKDVETKDFLRRDLATGKIDGNLSVQGSINKLVAALSLEGKNIATDAVRLGNIRAGLRLKDGNLQIDKLDIKNRKSEIKASGNAIVTEKEKLVLLKEPAINMNLIAKRVLLEDFTDLLKGSISIDADIKGTPSNPEGHLKVLGSNFDLGVQKVKKIAFITDFKEKQVHIRNIDIKLGKGQAISGKGKISFDKKFDIQLETDGIDLNKIDYLARFPDISDSAEGAIHFDILAKGTPDNPQVSARAGIKNLAVKGKSIGNPFYSISLKNDQIKISGKTPVLFNLSYHLKKKDFSAMIGFDKIKLEPWFQLAGRKDLAGLLDAEIRVDGNSDNLEKVRAEVDIKKFDMEFNDIRLLSTKNAKVTYQNKEVVIPGFQIGILKHGKLDIKGRASHDDADGYCDITAKGNIPLSAIRAFADELHDIDGNLHIDTSVKGNLKKPDILAVVKFEEIGMSIPSLSQKLAGLNGRLELNKKGLKIDEIKGNIDTGSFALSGKIDMKDYKPEKLLLTLKAIALPIAIPDTMDLIANADITMSGTPDKSKLDGDITILEGSYTKDVDMTLLAVNAGEKKRESSPVKKQYEQPFLKDLSLGIQIRRRQAFIVDNNMVHMELHPDLAVYGKLHNPLVSGRAEIMEGTITYQKSPFEIKKGVIDFVNPYKIEATIDIDSEMEIRKWKIFLAISGTPENLDFKLTSDPVEEDTDIFALLTTGKTARELIGNEGGSSQSPAKMVAELVASALGDELKDATGLDTLEVEFDDPASDTNDSSDRVKVTLGKDLSRRMSVKYAVESKDGEMVQRAITEYKFLENLLMTGFQDSNGTFGGELQFRLDFR